MILALALGTSADGEANGQNTGQHPHAASHTTPPPRPAVQSQSNPWQAKCDGAQPGEDDNLCYERRSTKAAEQQAAEAAHGNGWARGQFWLSIYQAGGLTLTVLLTLFGVNLARRALTQVERAFVFVEDYDVKTVGPHLHVGPKWTNSGSTPAIRAVMRSNWKSFQAPLDRSYDFPEFDLAGNQTTKFSDYTSMFLGPRAPRYGAGLAIPMSDVQAVAAGTAFVYVWGWVEYNDVLSRKRRRTEFCEKLEVLHSTPDPTPEAQRMKAHITLRTHWQHNGADGQCMKKPDPWPGNRR